MREGSPPLDRLWDDKICMVRYGGEIGSGTCMRARIAPGAVMGCDGPWMRGEHVQEGTSATWLVGPFCFTRPARDQGA